MFNQSLLLWALARPLEALLAELEMRAREDFEADWAAVFMLTATALAPGGFIISGGKKHTNIIFLMISPTGWENFRGRFLGTFWASPGPGTGPKCSPKT